MSTFSKHLRNTLGPISIFLGFVELAMALTTLIIMSDDLASNGYRQLFQWSQYKPVTFPVMPLSFFSNIGKYFEITFGLMLMTGGIKYLIAKSDRSGLLRFCYSIVFYASVMSFVWYLLWPIVIPDNFKNSSIIKTNWYTYMPMLYVAVLLLFSFFGIHLMRNELKIIKNVEETNSEIAPQLPVLSKELRFVHLILDLLLIASLSMPLFGLIGNFLDLHRMSNAPKIIVFFIILLHRFIYYLIFEGLFRLTPAKYFTASRVVNEADQSIPGFGTIMIRTLCRFIPFEPFSFFGRRGWHDDISKTSVVTDHAARPGRPLYGVWLILLFLLPTLHFLYKIKMENKRNMESREMNARIETSRKEGLVTGLSSSHFIVYAPIAHSYRDPYDVFKVDSVSSDSVWGYTFQIEPHLEKDRERLIESYQNSVRDRVQSMATKDIRNIYVDENNGMLLPGGQLYNIKEIIDLDDPRLTTSRSSTRRDRETNVLTVSWTLESQSKPLTLKSIEALEGDLIWKTMPPKKFEFNTYNKRGYLTLQAEFPKRINPFKAVLTLQDEDGSIYDYYIEQADQFARIYRKY